MAFARISDDGTYTAVVYEDSVKLLKNGELLFKLPMVSTKFSLSFSPDNRFFTLGRSSILFVHSCSDGSLIHQYGSQHDEYILDVSWSPDSRYVAIVNWEKTSYGIRVYDTHKGDNEMFSYPAGGGGVAFSPDGKYLAACGFQQNISLWDTETWEKKEVDSEANHYQLWCISWSPDGTHLVAAGRDVVILYNIDGWICTVRRTAFSAIESKFSRRYQNLCFLYGSEGETVVFDCASGQFVEAYRSPNGTNTLCTTGTIYHKADQIIIIEPNITKLYCIIPSLLKSALSDPRIWQRVSMYTLGTLG